MCEFIGENFLLLDFFFEDITLGNFIKLLVFVSLHLS